MNTRLTKIKDTEILSAVPESGHVMAEVDGVVKRVPGNKVGGVPDGAKENQYLAADKNGKAKWRDPLAYKFDKPQTQYIDADGDINILCKVSDDIPEPPSEGMGYVIIYDNAQQEATGYIAFDDDGGYSLFENYMVVVKKAGAELPGHAGVVFPETGIYMQKIIGYWHTQQVTWDGFSISWDGVTENVQPMPANGLAENPAPNKQLVTDSNGNTVWEDRLAWKEERLHFDLMGVYDFCKVSDEVSDTIPETIASIIAHADGTTENKDLSVMFSSDNAYLYTEMIVAIAKQDNATINLSEDVSIVFPEKGVYMVRYVQTGSYTAKATWDGQSYEWDGTFETIKPIDPEFIGGVMRVIITAETDGTGEVTTYSASHTYTEIEEAFFAGKVVECIYRNWIFALAVMPGASGYVTYGAALPITFTVMIPNKTAPYYISIAGNDEVTVNTGE